VNCDRQECLSHKVKVFLRLLMGDMDRAPGKNNKKVIVVMPAHNAARTLERTYAEIPKAWVDEVILVDDASTDETFEVARRLPVKAIRHERNRGYGANQKTCYTEALKDGADIVVMIHADYQYDPKLLPQFVEPIAAGRAQVVLGSRVLSGQAIQQGMPRYKYYSNKVLGGINNLAMGTSYTDLHSGYRAYSRRALEAVSFMRNSDDHVFDAQMVLQLHAKGFRIIEVPVPAMYHQDASSLGPVGCAIYGTKALGAVTRYLLHRAGIVKSRLFE
jgi:glycosyltransferase involved in cell wall biosynthesis